MPLNLQTHKYEKDKTTGRPKLTEYIPYISIRTEHGELFIQDGKVWTRTGPEVKDLPAWFWDEIKKLTPESLAEVRFKLPKSEIDTMPGPLPRLEETPIIKRRGRPPKKREE